MSDIDVLRQASMLIRERAKAATHGRWIVFDMDEGVPSQQQMNEDGWWWVWAEDNLPHYGGILNPDPHAANCTGKPDTCCRRVVGIAEITDGSDSNKERLDANHVASWDPAVALEVADWLDEVIERHRTFVAAMETGDTNLSETAINDTVMLKRALAVARTYLRIDKDET